MNNTLKKGIIITAIAGAALGVWIYDPDTIEPINDNGIVRRFDYTDDNKDECLLIYTDNAVYRSGDVYFAVKNTCEAQDVDIQLLYSKQENTSKVEVFVPDVPHQITKAVIGDRETSCETEWTKQTIADIDVYTCGKQKAYCSEVIGNICYEKNIQTGTKNETIYLDEWQHIGEQNIDAIAEIKPVPDDFIPKNQYFQRFSNGETKYFKASVNIKVGVPTNGELMITAKGDLGGYGQLR